MTVEEYLALEGASPMRHEFVEGEVYEMSGVARRHVKIVSNIARKLLNASYHGPCNVAVAEMKVRVRDRFYYPDVFVVCTPGDDDDLVETNPCLIVEVTSPTTARLDRGEKRDAYISIPSLRGYLVVDHRYRRVDWYLRDDAGEWRSGDTIGEGTIHVPCPDTTLTLDEIYEGVELPAVREPEAQYDTADA